MGKKSANILNPINFVKYLKSSLSNEVFLFIEILSTITDVLVFSGVIRNFVINPSTDIRDLDLVLNDNEEDVEIFLKIFNYRKNSYGGYKLFIGELSVDIWYLKDTWAFKNNKVERLLFDSYNLPLTAFFNFSSVVYNFNNKSFISSKNFLSFIKKREIDLVLEENPYPELCIVNTIYYKERFKLKVSTNLKKYYVKNFPFLEEEKFNLIQEKHFEEVKYSYSLLKEYYLNYKQKVEKVK